MGVTNDLEELLRTRKLELSSLASSGPMVGYLRNQSSPPHSLEGPITPAATNDPPQDIKVAVSLLLQIRNTHSTIAVFSADKHLLFEAELPAANSVGPVVFRTNSMAQYVSLSDATVWNAKDAESVCTVLPQAAVGATLRCVASVPGVNESRGAVVSDLKLESLLAEVARQAESEKVKTADGAVGFSRMVVVLDKDGQIVYHTNDALKHQQVSNSFPEFGLVARRMSAGETGTLVYRSAEGHEWVAAYAPLEPQGLSIAITRLSSPVMDSVRRAGWLGLILSVGLGLGLAAILTALYQQRAEKIERVTEDVRAIARGDLDLHIEARSRDDIRPLADSVNLMTDQLRKQIAREAETRQFQSFVKLSAVLTHDLKNAIGSLSLLVSNMEQHFNDAEFRADAMRSLTEATEKMQALVDRISNPVNTLSGEFKRAQPVDLVPIMKRIVENLTAPFRTTHRVETSLPSSLFALVDAERIEKVIENLVLNALEAMAGMRGTLRVEAGTDQDGKVFLKFSDTGVGMSSQFIEERLFHAFATTKRKGMGLGLYTCREVVQAHGGAIEVESRQGAGTTFSVVLPSPPSSKDVSIGT